MCAAVPFELEVSLEGAGTVVRDGDEPPAARTSLCTRQPELTSVREDEYFARLWRPASFQLRQMQSPAWDGHLTNKAVDFGTRQAVSAYLSSMDALALAILILGIVAGLLLVPLGLPGLWVMVITILAYGWLTDFRSLSVASIGIVLALAFIGEIIESWLGFRFAKRYGGSSRSGWGALIGGIVGAVIGVPIPVIGSVIGAFVGSFIGAALFEYSASHQLGVATRAGWGSVVGRAAAAAAKIGLGVIIAVIAAFAALS